MNLFGVMDISGSALKAERVRAEVVASNMANSETTRTADGGPYRRHHVVFSAADSDGFGASLLGQIGTATASKSTAGGVDVTGVIEDQGAPLMRFDPQHPDAGADGYVAYPDINPLTEMVDLMGATRSYGLNASAVQAEKGMVANSLEILK
jgi:flagellar basal-body rod protein FlgC